MTHIPLSEPAGPGSVEAAASAMRKTKLPRASWGWALFEAGQVPYHFLITGYVFMPYFVSEVVGDPVEGQALVASASKTAGMIMALTAPLLGATLDLYGPRKPWLALSTVLVSCFLCALWFVQPGGEAGLSIGMALTMIVVMKLCLGYTEVVHNSMLVGVAGRAGVSRTSALGLTLGNILGIGVMLFMLLCISLPGTTDWALVLSAPLFGLEHETYETKRVAGPIAAILMATLALPLFFWVKDMPRSGRSLGGALSAGARSLLALPGVLRGNRDAAAFLLGRMLYADGAAAILIFTGLYAAGVMKWGAAELLVLGLCRTAFAALGAVLGGALDAWMGSKRALQFEVGMVFLSLLVMISCAHDSAFFFLAFESGPPLLDIPLMRSVPEVVFLSASLGVTMFGVASAASSRALLTRLTPPAQTGSFFGLFALAGTVTAWIGPLLVEVFTRSFSSQQAGFAPLLVLIGAGFVVLLFIRGGDRPEGDVR